ncbi:Tetratricopeptide repeat-containing protein [Aquiflexum balticum DSM 16537]|uniref:Tetratricopeptide repeat-containing protein n=1 Tax=Aquiflexum balticum DSM 16537 TaxID=758820 RepID=A0A1W2H7F7_9BACT|nr:tetratricopeptide repeat protein [Aquiflexum balticum]SMD44851.1 Tetratricopeptide repeat-containing protein [Aquiflexum balticum DSM 16537]
MQIFYQRSEFLKKLFPDIDLHNDDQLKLAIKEFYKHGKLIPEVKISGDSIEINISDEFFKEDPAAFQKANLLCQKRKFSDARPFLEDLIKRHPTISEYYRTLAQTYEEEGSHEEAIDILIDALKWNPSNHWALILMGNIYIKYYKDVNTAMTYFDQVVESDPNNYVVLNNIGGTFLQLGKLTLAERFLSKAFKANPKFPNVTLGLGLVNFQKGEFRTAFDFAIDTFKNEEHVEGPVFQKALQLALDSAKSLVKQQVGKESLVDYIQEIENLTGKEVRIEEDSTISTAAKVEFAENYGRDFHLVKTNPKYPNTDHLIAHELTHLKLAEEARKGGVNMLFIGKDSKLEEFKKSIQGTLKKLEKRGIPESSIFKYSKDLFKGILSQVFNTPIDLFIEDYLYNHFPELRYVQFISLYQLNVEAHKAVNDPKIIDLSPPDILTKSRIFNVVYARHFETLFGIKMEKTYSIRPFEKEQIDAFWDEFSEYRNDREAGEEYELVLHWGEDLELDAYFELVDEIEYRSQNRPSSKSPEDVLTQIEQDPMQMDSYDEDEAEELRKFQEQHAGKDINMAVAMYMIGALEYFKGMSTDKVKEIAYEIAMLGRTGINPKKKGYKLNKIPGTSFSGYRLLAYYYVSWAVAIPEMLKELQMPFDKEYELALTLFNH